MEQLDKKKVLAVVLIIAVIAALGGAVSLFYNSIDMFTNTTFYDSTWGTSGYEYVVSGAYKDGQKPLAIITLVAALTAFSGVVAGISSFVVKKPKLKKISLIVGLVTVLAFVVFIIAARCVWDGFYKEYVGDKFKDAYPHYLSNNGGIASIYTIYSVVMTALIPELVYFAIIAAALFIVNKLDKKEAKAETKTKTVEANDIISENKGE